MGRTGDITCAEQQFTLLAEPGPARTHRLATALQDQGEPERTRAVLQRYSSLGGEPTPEISNTLLSVCAALNDAAGAELAASTLATMAPLNDMQLALLQRAVGEDAGDSNAAAGEPAHGGQSRARVSLGSSGA